MEADRLRTEYRIMAELGVQYVRELQPEPGAALARIQRAEPGPQRVAAVLAEVKAQREDIRARLGRSGTIPDLPSALAVWIELSEMLLQHETRIGRFALERLDIETAGRNPTLKLSGEVEDATQYQILIDTLKARPMFRDVNPGATRQTQSGLRFTELTVNLNLSAPETST